MSRADELFARLRKHGEAAIDELIADFQSENLWLDFKRSASVITFDRSDRENLAKAISGFANSDGGVIVWGVDCRPDPRTKADLPGDKYQIEHPPRFVSWLESAGSSCVTPAAPGLEHAAIETSEGLGFVVSLIPKSDLAPHQCIQPSTRLQYYMRAGSNFVPVPHAVLAGMFGRRPQPRLFTFYDGMPKLIEDTLDLDVGLRLMNEGPASASGPYLSFRIQMPGPNCRIGFAPRLPNEWVAHEAFSVFFSVTARSDVRIFPHIPVQPVRFRFQFAPPFETSYFFEMHYGCDGGVPGLVRITLEPDAVRQAYARSVDLLRRVPGADALNEIFTLFVGQNAGDSGEAVS